MEYFKTDENKILNIYITEIRNFWNSAIIH